MSYCDHGVPVGSHCRWCTDGGTPEPRTVLTDEEREERKREIRAEWAKQLKARR